jgi:hypothetical protein
VPEGERRRLRPGVHAELGRDALHVALGGERADPQLVGDLARGLAGSQSSQDLGLRGP